MRGFLSLEPEDATRAALLATQNRLRDALARQGVHFPDRFGATLLAWPFATYDELDLAVEAVGTLGVPTVDLGSLAGRPNDDRPAEIGFALAGAEGFQVKLFRSLREVLDPDPPVAPFIRLVRVAPPSRKVGAALRASALLGSRLEAFVPSAVALWVQTPTGFEIRHMIALQR